MNHEYTEQQTRHTQHGDDEVSGCPIGAPPNDITAPKFTPPAYFHPPKWPSAWAWLKTSRSNALGLFPQSCFQYLQVEHSIFGQRLVVMSDPKSIAEITGAAASSFRLTNMHLRMLKPALGDGLIVAQDDVWRAHRRVSVKIMSRSNKAELTSFSKQQINAKIEGWLKSDKPVSIQPDLALLAIDLLVAEVFDHHVAVGDDRVKASIETHRNTVEKADPLDMLGAPLWLASLRLRLARKVVHDFDRDIHAAIAASKTFAPPAGFSRDAQRDFVVNIMSGFESVATTCTWLLGLIATEPALSAWLTEKLISEEVRYQRINSCVMETMRLFPPLPLIYRKAMNDYQAPSGRIKKGSLVCFSPYVVHRHEALWDKPSQFDPLRSLSNAKHSPFMPFGTGARQCVGKQLGPRLVGEIIHAVLAKSRLQPVQSLPVPRAGLSLRPEDPVMIEFSRA